MTSSHTRIARRPGAEATFRFGMNLPRVVVASSGAVALMALSACGASDSGAGGDFPSQDVTVIAASNPGGGLDILSRMVQESADSHDLLDVDLEVENMGDGGGNVARAELLNRRNDGHTVVAETNRIFLNPLTGTTELDVDDFTPIAKMATDYQVWAVLPDSEWKSASEVIDAVSEDPQAVTFGVGTVPSDDQFNVLAPMNEAGVEDLTALSITTFDGGADLKANLLGGQVDIASTSFSELSEDARNGDLRFLVVSADEAQGGALEGVPTWHDEGIDFTLDHWIGIWGPADMPEEALEWWQERLEEVSESQTWEDRVNSYELIADFVPSSEFTELVAEQRSSAEELINAVGLGARR